MFDLPTAHHDVDDYSVDKNPFVPQDVGDFTHLSLLNRVEAEMACRNLKEETMEEYRYYIQDFLIFIGRDPENTTIKDVEDYIEDMVSKSKDRTIARNALRLLLREIIRVQ